MADLGVYLADVLLKARVYGLPALPGQPPLQMAQLSIAGEDAALAIPALEGAPGPPGAPAPPFKWQFPALDAPSELPGTLADTATDRGKAWVVKDGAGTADVAYWTGTQYKYFVDAFGPGLPGPTPQVTATGERVAEDAPFEVDITGSASAPNLHFKIPGMPGPDGPAGPWPLFNAAAARAAGDVPTWDAGANKFVPAAVSVPRPRRYTLSESSFTAYSGTNASVLLAAMVLPAQPWPCHVDVSGHLRVGQASGSSSRVAVSVRLNDQLAGQIVAKGLGVTTGVVQIGPHYSSQTSGQTGVASSPESTVGLVAADTAATLYVVAGRDSGSGGWTADSVDAQLSVTMIPAG